MKTMTAAMKSAKSTDLGHLKDAVQSGIDATGAAVDRLAKATKKIEKSAISHADQEIEHAREIASSAGQEFVSASKTAINRITKTSRELWGQSTDCVSDYVKTNPVKGVAIATGIGAVLTALIVSGLRRRAN